jgi:hypothetical protein
MDEPGVGLSVNRYEFGGSTLDASSSAHIRATGESNFLTQKNQIYFVFSDRLYKGSPWFTASKFSTNGITKGDDIAGFFK